MIYCARISVREMLLTAPCTATIMAVGAYGVPRTGLEPVRHVGSSTEAGGVTVPCVYRFHHLGRINPSLSGDGFFYHIDKSCAGHDNGRWRLWCAQDGARTRKACSLHYRGRGNGSPLCLPISPPGQNKPVPFGGRVFYHIDKSCAGHDNGCWRLWCAQDGARTRKACRSDYRGRGSGNPLCLPISPPGQNKPVPFGGRVF